MSSPVEKPLRSDQDIINEKNVRALDAAATQDRKRIDVLDSKVKALQAQYITAMNEVTALKAQLMVFLAQRGSGKTS
jgi:hypothetical protein